jgi:hypothetical protein
LSRPGQRGGAGVANRLTSGANAGPACAARPVTQFTFAAKWALSPDAAAKRAAAVADHLADEPGLAVVEELVEDRRLWLTLAAWPPMRLDDVERIVETCPASVPDSLAVPR